MGISSGVLPRAMIVAALILALAALQLPAVATTVTINPSDDGSIYNPEGVFSNNYLLASGEDIRGVVEFATDEIPDVVPAAWLSVNPYALPLYGPTVAVYGYESYDGRLTMSDYDAGTFLGDWVMPDVPHFGQDIFFDVTTFVQEISSPFVGFCLRALPEGMVVFSSLEHNYGHPAQLTVTSVAAPVPEPATWVLFLAGLGIAGVVRSRRKHWLD